MSTCLYCGEPVSADRDYRYVSGWERMSRGAGGTNAVRVPDRSSPQRACMHCVGLLAKGISPMQATIFSD